MKTTLQKVRDSIAAALLGKTPEQLEEEQRQDAVKSAIDDYLIRHPDWKPSTKPAPKAAPVTNSKQKTAKIKKALGAGAGKFIPHVVDEAALERARIKCREIVAADPAAYSYIIESAPIKGGE
ncbi:TPA: hypothetical protein ACTW9U_003724 [Klebsiella quasipneumoniae subsp. similipneumoniae]